MSEIKFGGPREIPYAKVKCPMDAFENHIREIGVVTACEWFGYDKDSDFVKETIEILMERTEHKEANK